MHVCMYTRMHTLNYTIHDFNVYIIKQLSRLTVVSREAKEEVPRDERT